MSNSRFIVFTRQLNIFISAPDSFQRSFLIEIEDCYCTIISLKIVKNLNDDDDLFIYLFSHSFLLYIEVSNINTMLRSGIFRKLLPTYLANLFIIISYVNYENYLMLCNYVICYGIVMLAIICVRHQA